MGSFVKFHCDSCGNEESILYGIGMMFPDTYREVLSAVNSGKYGTDMMDIAAQTPGVAVDAEWYLYICPECGTWKNDYGLTLYEPDNPENTMKDYAMLFEIQDGYHVKKRFIHKCPSCGKRMHRFREGDKPICPKCHQGGHIDPGGLWD